MSARRIIIVAASFGIGALATPLSFARFLPLIVLVAIVAVVSGGDS